MERTDCREQVASAQGGRGGWALGKEARRGNGQRATTDRIRLEPVETRGEEGRPAEQICVMKCSRAHACLDDSHGVDDAFFWGLMKCPWL